jgi:hypothetical protein
VVPLVERLDEAGRPFRYRIGPAARDPADPATVALRATAGLAALRPLRPVHLRARREPGGVRLAWIRRTRRDGDSWDAAEVRLEEPEAYRVTLYAAAGRPLRTLSADRSDLLYAAADEAADFGAPQGRLDMGVAQVGAAAGPGPETRTQVPVEPA